MACPKHAPQTGENRPRRWNAAGFLPFRLEVLTPVFVGTGEELSPLDYVIRKEGREHVLYLADCAGWLQAHAADPAIGAALAEGDMLGLRRLLTEQLDEKLYGLARLPFTLPATALELQKRITDPRSNSKAEILPLPRSSVSGCAFLPGSSLKGALLMPLIDHLDNRRTAGQGDLRSATAAFPSRYTEALKKMFGDIGNHAMQALKVADIPLAPQATGIVAAREVRRAADPNKPGTPKPPCEALLPVADGSLPPYGSLHLDCRSGQPAVELPGGEVLPWQRIGELCNAFYGMRFLREWQTFYALPHLERVRQALQPVRARLERLDPAREWLVRVGRYSHLECMTVSRNAPKHKKGYGKTRTLADNTLGSFSISASRKTTKQARGPCGKPPQRHSIHGNSGDAPRRRLCATRCNSSACGRKPPRACGPQPRRNVCAGNRRPPRGKPGLPAFPRRNGPLPPCPFPMPTIRQRRRFSSSSTVWKHLCNGRPRKH